MGAWGTGILQNDTTADVWAEFKQLYHLGYSLNDICKKLEEEYSPIDEDEEFANFWTGIAHGQWMCGGVTQKTINKLKECVEKEKGLVLWKVVKTDFEKRRTVISEYIEKIQTPRENPLKRKKINPCPSYFKKGDILSIELDKGQFIFGLTLSEGGDNINGENTIIFSSLISDKEISVQGFLDSNICYLDLGGSNYYHRGYFKSIFSARNMKRKIKKTRVLGNIKFKEYVSVSHLITFGNWNSLQELFMQQACFQKEHKPQMPHKISFKNFIAGRNPDLEMELIEHAKHIDREKLNSLSLRDD